MASRISNSINLPSDPIELGDGSKLLLQEKQAGITSDLSNQEIFVTIDKLLEYKCISKKQHKQHKCNLLHIKRK